MKEHKVFIAVIVGFIVFAALRYIVQAKKSSQGGRVGGSTNTTSTAGAGAQPALWRYELQTSTGKYTVEVYEPPSSYVPKAQAQGWQVLSQKVAA